ncbi:RidA family protein [Paraburkholderia oxyphila]|uniref:RidA family protein n=1 Tax=Paraburkholderia oxyphila TaxID=614212 RepID=UPI00047F4198|nr:RidA family protein [Paraburkholderia oxyphila]
MYCSKTKSFAAAIAVAAVSTMTLMASAKANEYITSPDTDKRAYSLSVDTQGGKTIYLAGQLNVADLNDKPLPGDFDGQARAAFQRIQKTLEASGGKLSDIVSMTVFITDVRNGERFSDIRREFFAPGKYPASALIAIRNLGIPNALIEIQATAVVGGK